jgi:transposase
MKGDKTDRHDDAADRLAKDVRRKIHKLCSSEDKIRIVSAGLRGEDTIAELCRQEGIAQSQYYSWSKEFMKAGRKRFAGNTAYEANTDEVKVCAVRSVT